MPRKVTAKLQRTIAPDRKYQSVLVQRLINKSMLNGKKHVAEKAVYDALEIAAKKLGSENPLEVFEKAVTSQSRYDGRKFLNLMAGRGNWGYLRSSTVSSNRPLPRSSNQFSNRFSRTEAMAIDRKEAHDRRSRK